MRRLDWQTVRGEGRVEVGEQHLSCCSNAKDDNVRMAGAGEKEREREKRKRRWSESTRTRLRARLLTNAMLGGDNRNSEVLVCSWSRRLNRLASSMLLSFYFHLLSFIHGGEESEGAREVSAPKGWQVWAVAAFVAALNLGPERSAALPCRGHGTGFNGDIIRNIKRTVWCQTHLEDRSLITDVPQEPRTFPTAEVWSNNPRQLGSIGWI